MSSPGKAYSSSLAHFEKLRQSVVAFIRQQVAAGFFFPVPLDSADQVLQVWNARLDQDLPAAEQQAVVVWDLLPIRPGYGQPSDAAALAHDPVLRQVRDLFLYQMAFLLTAWRLMNLRASKYNDALGEAIRDSGAAP